MKPHLQALQLKTKYFPLVEEGYPIVEIRARKIRGLSLPLDSCYQYMATKHLDNIRCKSDLIAESCSYSDGGGSSNGDSYCDMVAA